MACCATPSTPASTRPRTSILISSLPTSCILGQRSTWATTATWRTWINSQSATTPACCAPTEATSTTAAPCLPRFHTCSGADHYPNPVQKNDAGLQAALFEPTSFCYLRCRQTEGILMRQLNCVTFLCCPFRSYLRLILTLVMMIAAAFTPVTAASTGPARTAIPVKVLALRTEYKENPLGIDSRQPRLSWQLQGEGRGIEQSAYQVRVAQSEQELRAGRPLIWDSGRVKSDESVHRPYDGPPPPSGRRYYWPVRVWGEKGVAADWSPPAYWEMGLLQPSDWYADWIEPVLNDTSAGPAPILRRQFNVSDSFLPPR